MRQIQMEDLGTIRFTTVPRGGAPLEIREQWVGVEVPCLFSHNGVPPKTGDIMLDVATGLQVPDYPGYIVLQTHAIDALREKSPEAARHWMEHGFPQHEYALFLFDLNSAEVLKPIKTREEFWQSLEET